MNIAELHAIVASDISTMPASKLRALRDRIAVVNDETCDALIAQGYGHERPSECRIRAQETQDTLALLCVAAWEALSFVNQEFHRRKQWHGGDHPIKAKDRALFVR